MAAAFRPIRAARAWLALCLVLVPVGIAQAQTLLRDPDIEHALRQLSAPLSARAGLGSGGIDVLVIKDDRMNAFITDGRTVFVHSGMILRAGSAAELQAVIAHEIAHVANGHISRRMANARAAGRTAAAGMALGLAAALAGEGEAGGGLAMGVSSSAHRVFLGHTRAEEAAADASGLRYMAEAGVDPNAAVTLLERFRGQEALSAGRQDLYVRAHPLTRDRLRAAKGLAAALPVADIDQGASEYWFRRAQGKLSAFIRNPGWTLRRLPDSGGSDLEVMQRAIALHRRPDPARARAEIDRLAGMRPNDPFVHELRGQILLEGRNLAGAVRAYGRAAEIAPANALILGGLGRALLAAGDGGRALDVLARARDRDPRDPRVLRDLAVAYARAGQNGLASVVTAERYALLGRIDDAAIHAKRAEGLLPRGSPGWRRAQDILIIHERSGE